MTYWNKDLLNFARYPVSPQRLCCDIKDDFSYAHIPRRINPASPLADYAKGCGACGFSNREPLTGCFDPKRACRKNGVPYDSKTDLIMPPYSMPYETKYDCQQPVCKESKLRCTKTHRGAMYNGAQI